MDFIKTSSLRALIELTFQRNWNGLIWMSRKGVTTKRVKTVQTALSRISAQPRSPAGRGTNMFHARPNLSVRLKSRPKSKTVRPNASRPGKLSPRSATPQPPRQCRARPCRPSRETNASRPRDLSRDHGRRWRPSDRIRPDRPTVPTPRSTRSPF
ncbi:unnamed protein product [Microthlaspi erraticum]|uniref:Uncharacterized protein n=1 Tax=Microthlaspi erraticum TaxID=1685480 RepID=A0A6D2KP45_9BRAS|nr:unnamed protein product [Microthlaspi erraticum]